MNKFFGYIQDSYNELLHKVTWPTWSSLQQSTIITLVGFLLLTVVISIMDKVNEIAFETFYGLFK